MNEVSLAQQKKTWTMVVAAFAFSVVIYGLLANMMNGTVPVSSSAATLRPFMYALAGAGLVGSLVWFFLRTAQASPGPGVFHLNTIIALALAESCSLAGLLLFFISAPLQELYYFLGASLFVMVFVILPRGLQHWAEIEASEASMGD